MSDAAKQKAHQRWAIEKPKVDNARQSRRIFFIEPNDEEFKPLGESWKFRCPQQCLAKIPIKSSGETHRNIGERKAKIRLCC